MLASIRGCFAMCLVSLLPIGTAIAEVPRVLDVIPREKILIAVAVERLDSFDGKLRQFMTAVGDTAFPPLTEIIRLMGFQDGLNMAGSAAWVQVAPPATDPDAAAPEGMPPLPAAVFILPVTQQDTFLKGVNASKAPDANHWRFEVAGTVYYTSAVVGGYLACSEDLDSIRHFGTVGHLEPHAWKWGILGRQISTSADVVIVGDVKKLGAAFEALSTSLPNDVNDPGQNIPATQQMASFMQSGSFLGRLARLLRDESQGGIAGLTMLSDGLRVDVGASFFEGSILANASQQGMTGVAAMSLLPLEPYVAAVAIDAAHPGVRMLADELGIPGRVPGIAAELERLILNSIPTMDTLAIGIYTPPTLMFGSLTRSIIGWRSPTPESTADAFRQWITTLNNRPLESAIPAPGDKAPPGGIPHFASTYAPRNETIGGAAADEWSITPPKGAFNWMPLLLGQGTSIDGILLHRKESAYITWTRETALLGKAAGLAGKENSLDSDPLIAAVSANLPMHRAMEAYIDLSPLVQQFGMLGGKGSPLSQYPKPAPPIGACVTAQNSSAQLSIFIPTPALKLGWALQTATSAPGR